MSWRERDSAADDNPMGRFGRPGGDWQGLRPSLDNPITWSLPIGRLMAITVRVHVIFLIFVVIEVLRAAWGGAGRSDPFAHGFWLVVVSMACLFAIVLLHELGHCLACRRVGGEADEILMWPLGGLAFCRPPQRWQAHLVTVVGGPAVNVLLCAIMTPGLGFLTGKWWGVAIPNPFNPVGIYAAEINGHQPWWLIALFQANWLSLLLLLFNLLPIFPLDGGRIVQAGLWPKLGYAGSMRLAVRVGYVGAVLLGVVGFVLSNVMVVMIAVFGGIICYVTHKQLEFTEHVMGFETDQYQAGLDGGGPIDAEPGRPSPRQRRAERRARREKQETEQVDGILQKIARSGMESLSGPEKRLLRQATRRKRAAK
ncbi:MAG: site-2 protease family protein [Planctomycetota bacterium]|jgi:Zn-dependent protease